MPWWVWLIPAVVMSPLFYGLAAMLYLILEDVGDGLAEMMEASRRRREQGRKRNLHIKREGKEEKK